MDQHPCGLSTVKDGDEAIVDTGASYDMDPNYGPFLFYHHTYSGYYATLFDGSKETIEG